MKAYMIATLNYEYNDEEMYREGGVNLDYKKVYFDRNAATERYEELTIAEIRGINTAYEYYGNNSDADCNAVAEILSRATGQTWEESDVDDLEKFPEELSDDDILEIASLLELDFYEVVELDIDEKEARSELSKVSAVGRRAPQKKSAPIADLMREARQAGLDDPALYEVQDQAD